VVDPKVFKAYDVHGTYPPRRARTRARLHLTALLLAVDGLRGVVTMWNVPPAATDGVTD
jgi:hypothetical protein